MWEKELKAAQYAAVEAGKAIMEIYNASEAMEIEYKADDMPLTAADKAANEIIVKYLSGQFPEYAILSEESQDDGRRLEHDYCFVVDPLDGTKEFIKRNGQFTVNIALAYRHVSVMGVIYVPALKELYYASQGNGACRRLQDGTTETLRVSDNTDIPSLRVVMSNSHSCREMEELLKQYNLTDFVRVGSSLKGCMVASGQADIYYRFNPTMEWDTAAMQCIAEEAGAIVRQMDGTVMRYNRADSRNSKGFYIINREENQLVQRGFPSAL